MSRWRIFLGLPLLGLCLGCATSIDRLTPRAGKFGTEVSIKGHKLRDPTSIDFNGTPVVMPGGVLSAAGRELKVIVPGGATTGRVHVTTPAGTDTSPYDFTVATNTYSEQESNNTFDTANAAGLSDCVVGSLTSADSDWLKVRTGPKDCWGYTMEFSAEAPTMPAGYRLRVALAHDPQAAGGTFTTNDGNKTISWVALPPDTDVYLKVSSVGSGAWPDKVDYTVYISRIPINDKNEANDGEEQATPIAIRSGTGSAVGSCLCNLFDPKVNGGARVGFKDYYRIPKPRAGQHISVAILFAGLEGLNNAVGLELIDEDYVSVTDGWGNSDAGWLDYTVPADTHAQGDWYVLVTNSWDEDAVSGNGPAPLSCKRPYGIMVYTK